MTSHI